MSMLMFTFMFHIHVPMSVFMLMFKFMFTSTFMFMLYQHENRHGQRHVWFHEHGQRYRHGHGNEHRHGPETDTDVNTDTDIQTVWFWTADINKKFIWTLLSSVRYRRFRYQLSPISFITDIGMSPHLCILFLIVQLHSWKLFLSSSTFTLYTDLATKSTNHNVKSFRCSKKKVARIKPIRYALTPLELRPRCFLKLYFALYSLVNQK